MSTTLETFSRTLLDIVAMARDCTLEGFLPAAMQRVAAELPCRSMWWGWVDEQPTGGAPRIHAHGFLGLPETFADEWALVAAEDGFARSSIVAPGQVIRFSANADAPVVTVLQHFGLRHDLFHSMALTELEATSGMMFFLVAYRGRGDVRFGDEDSALFHELARHLVQLVQQGLRQALAQASRTNGAGLGLSNAAGRLLFADADLCRLLRQTWPGWDGYSLPAPLRAQLAASPCTAALGGCELEIRAEGDRFLLTVQQRGAAMLLSPRERRVALMYAAGHTYKDIAKALALSPATVRTYLRLCYRRLQVSNRIALSDALGRAMHRVRLPRGD